MRTWQTGKRAAHLCASDAMLSTGLLCGLDEWLNDSECRRDDGGGWPR
ncbi:hypothetical protein F4553_006187 [Allocatelliglobosispora scoriae]|uniref:Uncharacterized protein n=1 Tax=Allocatelliglobosispora scoriae TaxID=643052 RepID=A0A841C0S5_9ACTN|nr:hypothetical protein [Allocatelliglobosispora scoriae]MBB5872753.1 hypothetical protein [Allocatelliglobosispora scoriae]